VKGVINFSGWVVVTLIISACAPSEDSSTYDVPQLLVVDDRAIVKGCDGKLDWNAEAAI
jgi:hypothetical protein